jgi:hypothetical protein
MPTSSLFYNVSINGTNGDWYWEVITPARDIMARGLAPTRAQARAAAVKAGASYKLDWPVEEFLRALEPRHSIAR